MSEPPLCRVGDLERGGERERVREPRPPGLQVRQSAFDPRLKGALGQPEVGQRVLHDRRRRLLVGAQAGRALGAPGQSRPSASRSNAPPRSPVRATGPSTAPRPTSAPERAGAPPPAATTDPAGRPRRASAPPTPRPGSARTRRPGPRPPRSPGRRPPATRRPHRQRAPPTPRAQRTETRRDRHPGGEPRTGARRGWPHPPTARHPPRPARARPRPPSRVGRGGHGHRERIHERRVSDPQRASQRVPARCEQTIHAPVHQRREHVEQAAVAEMDLVLDPARGYNRESFGQRRRPSAQPTLPDPRRSHDDQRSGLTPANCDHELFQPADLAPAAHVERT